MHGYGIRPLIIIMSGLKPTPLCLLLLLLRVLGVVVIESRGLEEEEEAEEEGCNGGNLLRRRRRQRQRRHRVIRRIVNDQSGVAEWRSGARKQRCSADNVITYFELINHLLVMSK